MKIVKLQWNPLRTILFVAVALAAFALLLSLVGCTASQAAAKRAGAALVKFGGCAAERAWQQCAPVARDCLTAQFKQCAGLAPKAPWVQPQCVRPASQPAKR